MPRLLPNWLQGYREYTAESESPDSFHLWTGLSVIASAVRRRVWIEQNLYPLYPNLFVILVGPAGKVAKSTTIRLGRTILRGVDGIFFGPDSVTREELIRSLAHSEDEGSCAMTIHSTELSSLIEPSGIKMVQFLTDIYDCDYNNPSGWRYNTKGQGKDTLLNPVVNLLAGTTPSWIGEEMPTKVVEHGFTSRTIFVYEEDTRLENPFPDPAPSDIIELLQNDLSEIASLYGQFTYTDNARELYKRVYHQIHVTEPEDDRVSGFHWRKRSHILKVAMLLSLSETSDMVIHSRDIETAVEVLSDIEAKLPKTFASVGKYDHAMDFEKIYAQIVSRGGMRMSDILNKNVALAEPDKLVGMVRMLTMTGRARRVIKDGEEFLIPVSLNGSGTLRPGERP